MSDGERLARITEMRAPRGRFRADIQGLRAIAVVAVVLYHANHGLLPGGFVGVDVFFVLSGFLISGILLRELDRDEYSLLGFYRRRIRRLFPALYVMLAVTLAAGMALLPPEAFKELGQTAFATVLFISNFEFDKLSGYFGGEASLQRLLHTWSLAVEEQFYLLFPPVLIFLYRKYKNWLRPTIACAIAASLIISVWAVSHHPSAAFYLAPSRAFELLIGVFVSLGRFPPNVARVTRNVLFYSGLAFLLASFAAFNDSTPFPGLAALVPCVGTALILFSGMGEPASGSLAISTPIFVLVGNISYSLYLWHWPFLVFGRYFFLGPLTSLETTALISSSIVASYLSWRFVELPFLTTHKSYLTPLKCGVGLMTLGCLLTGSIALSNGLPSRFSLDALHLLASADDHNPRRDVCHTQDFNQIPYDENCLFGNTSSAPIAAVWGDSHGAELVVALGERLAESGQAIMEITASACPPALDYKLSSASPCAQHNKTTFDRLIHDSRIRAVVLTTNFLTYPKDSWPQLFSGYSAAVAGLRAAGKEIVIVYQIPTQDFDPPIGLALAQARGRSLINYGANTAEFDTDTEQVSRFLDDVSIKNHAVAFKPATILCDQSICHAYLPTIGGLYFNSDHLSLAGARFVGSKFPIEKLLQTSPLSVGHS